MKFWDASAIVPLLLDEAHRETLLRHLERDSTMLAWWGTPVECASAIARREREGSLSLSDANSATARLRSLVDSWNEVLPSEFVRGTAQRLLRVHPLRAADSLQLAAALVAGHPHIPSLQFVCLDDRLNDAAEREGFETIR